MPTAAGHSGAVTLGQSSVKEKKTVEPVLESATPDDAIILSRVLAAEPAQPPL